ncbi:hypothetical protein KCU81_g9288, partial [Aureobasidium melanogenum]|uniref:NAD dependent epimerase/dehydratase n=1 Tax=Aureobasidium melanogenum (strain CBS 110374) TaxID=1043003 RepID=A0A074VFK4_AURM1
MAPPALPALIEDILYPCPHEPLPPRTKPMRVLCLGLSRSGTDSLRRALYMLGFSHVWHGFNLPDPSYSALPGKIFTRLARRKFSPGSNDQPISREDFEVVLADCDAVTDTPAAIFAPELIAAYPEAKVILNVRDTEAWHKSMVSTLASLPGNINYGWLIYFQHRLYWTARSFFETTYYGIFDGDIERTGKEAYERHSESVRNATEPERLLEWRVEDGWGPLCEFLDVEIPDEEFPHGNNGEEFQRRLEHFKKVYRHQAYQNIFGLTGAVVAVAAFTYSWYARMRR